MVIRITLISTVHMWFLLFSSHRVWIYRVITNAKSSLHAKESNTQCPIAVVFLCYTYFPIRLDISVASVYNYSVVACCHRACFIAKVVMVTVAMMSQSACLPN